MSERAGELRSDVQGATVIRAYPSEADEMARQGCKDIAEQQRMSLQFSEPVSE